MMDPLTRRLFLAPNLIGLSHAKGLFASPKPQNSQRKFGSSTSFWRSQSRLSSLLLAIEASLMYTSVFRDVNHLACSPSSMAPGVTCRTLTHEIAYTAKAPRPPSLPADQLRSLEPGALDTILDTGHAESASSGQMRLREIFGMNWK